METTERQPNERNGLKDDAELLLGRLLLHHDTLLSRRSLKLPDLTHDLVEALFVIYLQ